MTFISDDRWTCPACGRTVLVIASPGDTRFLLEQAREHHRKGHAAGEEMLRHLGLPDPVPHQPTTLRRRKGRGRSC